MLATVRDRVAKLKSAGFSEKEAIAKKPAADLDPVWGKGFFGGGRVRRHCVPQPLASWPKFAPESLPTF